MPRSLPILVVDDTEICRVGIALMLEQLGFRADTAANGYKALEKVPSNAYGAIIMDYDMGGMTGAECTEEIKKLEIETDRHILVVGMTSNVSPEIRVMCLNAGMEAVLDKSCSEAKFLETLERLLLQRLDHK